MPVYNGDNGNNVIFGSSGADQIYGLGGDDTLGGGQGNDEIYGGAGNDMVNGEEGADLLVGGPGDDRLVVDDAGDVAVELADEGFDTLITAVNYVLPSGVSVEVLEMFQYAMSINLTGNELASTIYGNEGDNVIIGGPVGTSPDRMVGGGGSDTYYVNNVGDIVEDDATSGQNRLYASVSFTLQPLTWMGYMAAADRNAVTPINLTGNQWAQEIHGNAGTNLLSGLGGEDRLYGYAGNDTLDGGGNTDVLDGGSGSDLYLIAAAGDHMAAEFADSGVDGGIDEVRFTATVASTFILYAGDTGIERIVIGTGTGATAFTGGTAAINVDARALVGGVRILGNYGDNIIYGGSGDDYLDGGLGNDSLYGGAGNDTYELKGLGSVFEEAGQGTDTVIAWSSHILATNFENLSLSGSAEMDGTGNAVDNILSGNAARNILRGLGGNDTIYGNGGNDDIYGGDGNDAMHGGTGDDNYWFVDAGDTIVELAGEGNDTIYTMASYILPDNVETLILSNYDLSGTGNALANLIIGNIGNDVLSGLGGNDELTAYDGNDSVLGGTGNDILTGGAGIDTLTGGADADIFRDTASGLSGDTITDFTSADKIVLSDATLAGFAFSISGATLTYTGGTLTLTGGVSGTLVASAAAGGGVQLTIQAIVPPPINDVRNDFNGDGRSDILWRSTTGQLSDWLGQANGGFIANDANAFSVVPTSWTIVGTGDFNGDGRDDILWRNTNGQLSDWLGNANGGFTPNDANAATSVPTNWSVVGVGDFNGDGRDDILWRNTAGQLSNWLGTATGGFTPNDANAFTSVPTNWHVAGVGDFNGDGRDDILWRNDAGQLSNWLGNANGGFTPNDANAFASAPISWNIVGTGDFNGDGRDDILWRSTTGQLSNWLGNANGSFTPNDANAFTTVPTSWTVVAIGDYNGDGRDDILWRNTNGQLSNWLGNANGGFTPNDANAATSVVTSWHVQPEAFIL